MPDIAPTHSTVRTAALKSVSSRTALALGGATVLGITWVIAHTSLPSLPCPFKAMTHLPCPGCGFTRSFMALWHGDILLSFRYHPLGLPLFVACWGLLLYGVRSPSQGTPFSELLARRSMKLIAIGFALFFGLWVVRLGFVFSGSEFFLWR